MAQPRAPWLWGPAGSYVCSQQLLCRHGISTDQRHHDPLRRHRRVGPGRHLEPRLLDGPHDVRSASRRAEEHAPRDHLGRARLRWHARHRQVHLLGFGSRRTRSARSSRNRQSSRGRNVAGRLPVAARRTHRARTRARPDPHRHSGRHRRRRQGRGLRTTARCVDGVRIGCRAGRDLRHHPRRWLVGFVVREVGGHGQGAVLAGIRLFDAP